MDFASIDELQAALEMNGYVAERGLATSLYLSLKLPKPMFLEGEAGVGKTEVAKVLAAILGTELIRLQCYEGLDVSTAVYEWNYARQMMRIRLVEAESRSRGTGTGEPEFAAHVPQSAFEEAHLFGPEFLIKRPLLQAVTFKGPGRPVLLIDELDRADEEFEAFLLELLSDFQITVPEVGTFRPEKPPVVVITSNRTREIHDALKRRCLYHWIPYPDFSKEAAVLNRRLPETPRELALQVVSLVQQLRHMDLYKLPGVAETLDWTAALLALEQQTLSVEVVEDTMGALLKHQEDIERVQGQALAVMVQKAQREASEHGAA